MSSDIWDDDGWEDMPVLRSESAETKATTSMFDADAPIDDDEKDLRRKGGGGGGGNRSTYARPAPLRLAANPSDSAYSTGGTPTTGNATGKLVEREDGGGPRGLREKEQLDEMDYTRLELDDDPEEDEISMRTQYLFNEETSMTPLSQMQQTKTLLTEGQRIAYVGLSRLVAREMVQTLALAAKGAKELEPARESCTNWANKIMGRLYRHMDVDAAEQRMIEQLAEHGVTAEDLTPSLVATYTVDNPDYDPEAEEIAAREAAEADITFESEEEKARDKGLRTPEQRDRRQLSVDDYESRELEDRLEDLALGQNGGEADGDSDLGYVKREVKKIERRASEANTYDSISSPLRSPNRRSPATSGPSSPSLSRTSRPPPVGFDDDDLGGGDIGAALDEPPTPRAAQKPLSATPSDYVSYSEPPADETLSNDPPTPRANSPAPSSPELTKQPDGFLAPLPSSLPGVSKTLTAADKTVTLDIRWTILCDLFLALIADSVYDARSRVLLGRMAEKLGLEWNDVIRFERRLTEALEIQEAVKAKEHQEVLEGRRQKDKRNRYMMMGLATLGGGLVIGLSAGLLAPVIGAGLAGALTTVGVTGTSGFLAGAGGAAIISSGATLTGSVIGGKAMAKRTRHVKTFDIQPLHNNKRVNFFITVPGFMNGPRDDIRLPFSTIDPVVGDVLSVLWEPDMMGDTGNALKILTSEVLTQAGQQVLAATVMTALMSALQWPMMLTKLSYLIDNPWSNALDRARQAGAVLADILLNRRLGVRPVSLVGFSLGARVIFFALIELAKANAFGVVQEVYLFGATVTASKKIWRQVRGVVAGRFVNGYAMNDWVLGYLFRATTGGLQTVAGLRPIDHVPDLENVDITEFLEGHLSYRTKMPKLLAHVGFKTTADHFDEPDQDPDAPEREVLTKEEEERRLAEKEKKERKVLDLFKRKKKNGGTDSSPMSRQPSGEEYDLPPRLSSSNSSLGDLKRTSSIGASRLSVYSTSQDSLDEKRSSRSSFDSTISKDPIEKEKEEEEKKEPTTSQGSSGPAVVESIPVGFDLEKLRAEVAQQRPAKPEPERANSVPPEDLPRSTSATNSCSSEIPRPPSAPPPSAPLQTNLTQLDQTLDAHELLRRQWNGEVTGSSSSSIPPHSVESSGWASNASLPDDHFASSSSASTPSPFSFASPPTDTPTFTFADQNGFVDSAPTFTFGGDGGFSAWNASDSKGNKDAESDAPDPASNFVWGNKAATSSTATFATQNNPW
ncbi:uncharacterized protein JCM6883_005418 [Sporobolomyces salmoneus]|uniref:uncharacterized protein n=1 Tax=Sporobolomyces salmoneus TaxID=183962 RepID=UPI00317A623F